MRYLTLPLGCSIGWLMLASTCLAQASNWVQVQTKNSPPARVRHGIAHDIARARTVIFGGTGTSVVHMNDTWQYDGTNWTQMQPKTVPPARRLTSMVYHFARVETVLFGGNGTAGQLADTWTWNGINWKKLNPKNSPPARQNHSMVYDSGRQRTVLFGGRAAAFLNDTWEWDGVNWTQIQTKNAPSTRYAAGLAYDSARKRVVLFGGEGGGGSIQDTWEYDGTNWVQMKPANQPSQRCCVGIAYDLARQRTVLFGGWSRAGFFQDTWEYDGKNWVQMNPATKPPNRMDYDLMVYDQGRNRMVVFGGWGAVTTRLADTWEYVASQALTGSPSTISIAGGGRHAFALDAGTGNAGRLYWIFGSVTGTSPGVTLASAAGSVNIPLNPDFYTDITIALANTPLLTKTRGTLDGSGKGSASFNVPKIANQSAIGVKFYHAFLVYDAKSNFYMASNPVELMLVR